jgi:hypothetical protein
MELGRPLKMHHSPEDALLRRPTFSYMRTTFTVSKNEKKVQISCLENEYDLVVEAIQDQDQRSVGIWAFVTRCMDLTSGQVILS